MRSVADFDAIDEKALHRFCVGDGDVVEDTVIDSCGRCDLVNSTFPKHLAP